MNENEQIEELMSQTLHAVLQTIPIRMQEIKQNKAQLKVENINEFVYGVMMDMSFGITGTAIAAFGQVMQSEQNQIKVRDMTYSKIPQIREMIFN